MAGFIAKQMVGNQLKSVKATLKGAVGGGDDDKGEGDGAEAGEDPEVAEARREAEERRKEKHRKMEEERETMRQEIRDKYGIKKKEDIALQQQDDSGRIGRKRKTPAELAAEAEAAENEEDDFTSQLPEPIKEMAGKIQEKAKDCCSM